MNEIEGTENELVHDKIYEFTDAEETDFKELLKAVYKHIKSLDFINEDSPLYIPTDNTKGIKQIREFCNLIKEV
jgi:hypothetical protein